MRVAFRAMAGTEPVPGVRIKPAAPGLLTTGFPVPLQPVDELVTNEEGEAFAVAPLSLGPALYYLDATLYPPARAAGWSGPALRNTRVSGVFDEIENLITVHLDTGKWTRTRLPEEVWGDGWWDVEPNLLRQEDIVVAPEDPLLKVSSCAMCAYLKPVLGAKGTCIVNFRAGPAFEIPDARTTSCKTSYYPWFLPPSPQRVARDLQRITGLPLPLPPMSVSPPEVLGAGVQAGVEISPVPPFVTPSLELALPGLRLPGLSIAAPGG